ncbi:unnamed protein product [Penicillium viridicatum]
MPWLLSRCSQNHQIPAVTTIEDKSVTATHTSYSVKTNDTSALLIANGATLHRIPHRHPETGYSTNPNRTSFYGFNAYVPQPPTIPPTPQPQRNTGPYQLYRPNGTPSLYTHSTDTTVTATNSWLYSSGPVSNGLYASGNGTISTHNVARYSGSKYSSSFSGDSPKGDSYVCDSVAHSAGIGSATYYALETIEAYNVLSGSKYGQVIFLSRRSRRTLKSAAGGTRAGHRVRLDG